MPRLTLAFREFIGIIEANGFVPRGKQGATSHRRYKGEVDGEVRYVDISIHRESDVIKSGTLASMIRQSGLPKSIFRDRRHKRRKAAADGLPARSVLRQPK